MKIASAFTVRSTICFLTLMFAAFCYAILIDGSVFDPCEADIVGSTPAPDGRTTIIVFEMACGATAPFNTQASLAPAGRPFSPRKHPAFLILDGKHRLGVVWTAAPLVEIDLPQETGIFRRDTSAEGVTIAYRQR